MDRQIDNRKTQSRRDDFTDADGTAYRFSRRSGIYKPNKKQTQKNYAAQKKTSDANSFLRVEVARDWWIFGITALISVATFAIVCAYTYYAARQVNATEGANDAARKAMRDSDNGLPRTISKMQEQITQSTRQANSAATQADTAKHALVSVQRAFVFETAFDGSRTIDPSDPTKVGYLDFSITWENSGTTPTKNMREQTNWMARSQPATEDYIFTDPVGAKTFATALGPKGVAHSVPIRIAASEISRVDSGQEYLYFYGWARYRDVFPDSKWHLTRYCTQLLGFQGNPLSTNSAEWVKPITSNCGENCYDEECKIQ